MLQYYYNLFTKKNPILNVGFFQIKKGTYCVLLKFYNELFITSSNLSKSSDSGTLATISPFLKT